MTQAEGKVAKAALMARNANKKGADPEDQEIAKAALSAAKHQVQDLKRSKAKIEGAVDADNKELGELHSSIRSHVLEIKHDQVNDDHIQEELGDEQHSAMEEASTSGMQEHVDALAHQLSQERQIRETEEAE